MMNSSQRYPANPNNDTFKRLVDAKGLSVREAAEIIDYSYEWTKYFYRGGLDAPAAAIDAILTVPAKPRKKIERGAFIAFLSRLGLTPDQAAAILWMHHDRMRKHANPELDPRELVPIDEGKLRILEEAAI